MFLMNNTNYQFLICYVVSEPQLAHLYISLLFVRICLGFLAFYVDCTIGVAYVYGVIMRKE